MVEKENIKIGVIFVLYYPDKSNILKTIGGLCKDNYIVLVDNTPQQTLDLSMPNVAYIPLLENRGIAYAQNVGIRELKRKKCTYVIFFDQDSIVPLTYPNEITMEYARISCHEKNLFLLGPRVINKSDKKEYKSVFHKDNVDVFGFVKKREIISSGSCTTLSVIDKVGLLCEELFIDYVDFEWCWRANSCKLVSGITPKVILEHKVGYKEVYLWKYIIIISAPIRYLYQYRNYFYLVRKKYVPIQWKIVTAIKMALRFMYFPLFIQNGRKCWVNMIKGIKCGLKK